MRIWTSIFPVQANVTRRTQPYECVIMDCFLPELPDMPRAFKPINRYFVTYLSKWLQYKKKNFVCIRDFCMDSILLIRSVLGSVMLLMLDLSIYVLFIKLNEQLLFFNS